MHVSELSGIGILVDDVVVGEAGCGTTVVTVVVIDSTVVAVGTSVVMPTISVGVVGNIEVIVHPISGIEVVIVGLSSSGNGNSGINCGSRVSAGKSISRCARKPRVVVVCSMD